MSNLGGKVAGVPVDWKTQKRTLRFVQEALKKVPAELADPEKEQAILDELSGNFLPVRVKENGGEKMLKRYLRKVERLKKTIH